MPSLTSLDISENKIDCEDPEEFLKLLENMKALKVLYLQGNPIVKKISCYRKTLVARLPKLTFLDDRPVFPEDRIFSEAWYTGGVEAEREARKKWKSDQEEIQRQNTLAFRAMCDAAKREHDEKLENEKESDIKSLNTEEKNNLDTYYSSTDKDSEKILKESDSANRSTNKESLHDKSDSMSNSKEIDESLSDRVISTEKSQSNTEKNSETNSMCSKSETNEQEDKENIIEEDQIPIETQKIFQQSEYMTEFANNLSELD